MTPLNGYRNAGTAPAAPLKPLTIERLLQSVNDLPSLPEVALKVTRLVEDPSVSAAAIGRVVSTDQALTARVLRLANSAFYGVSRRIGTVQEAVVVLGFRTIKTLTLAASLYPALSGEVRGYALERGDLWRHSIACAVGAQALAKEMGSTAPRVGPVTPDEAFVAGLLHDIGKMVLSVHLKEYFGQTRDRALADNVPFLLAERAILGIDHAQAGAAMAERWNLPAALVDAIACHHDPLGAQHGNVGLACVTHVADALCLTLGIGVGGDGLLFSLRSEALDALGIAARPDELTDTFLEALRMAGPALDFDKAL
jgi:putative nucleotidyltransferase with HDIG domain